MKKQKKEKKEKMTARVNRAQEIRVQGEKRIGLLSKGIGLDTWTLILVCAFCLFGVVMVYSASYYMSIHEHDGDPHFYLFRQAIFVGTGFVLMLITSRIDYHLFTRLWMPAYVVGLALLAFVLVAGASANGGQRWIPIFGFTFMPGEFAKIAIIIAVTGFMARRPSVIEDWKGVSFIALAAFAYAYLVMKQPNMSTACTIVFIVGGMLFVAGAGLEKLGVLAGAGAAAAAAAIFTSDYRRARFETMLHPFDDPLGDGYQVVQSFLAFGKGGLTGVGLGNSVQKDLYLPFPHNDFILSIIGEELGYIGILVIMIAYVFLIYRGLRIAINAADYEGMLLASGIVIMIGVQVVMHIATVTSLMPPTGVVLPFISYGGTAMWVFMGSAGVLLNVSRSADI